MNRLYELIGKMYVDLNALMTENETLKQQLKVLKEEVALLRTTEREQRTSDK